MNPFIQLSRAIALVAPLQRDPRPALLQPGLSAAHTAEHFKLGEIPVAWLKPHNPTGATVIYAHGGGTADILPSAPLFEALLRRGIATVSFDFPGFGQHPAELGFEGSQDCLPRVLQLVQSRVGTAPVGLYGLSLGGDFALRAAAGAPWLRALALFGPPLALKLTERHRLLELGGTFHPLALPVLVDAPSGHVAKTFFEPVRFEGGGRHIIFEDEFAPYIDRLIEQLAPLEAAAALPPIPALILGGEWDAAAPPEDLRRLHAAFKGPCELRVFAHRTHTTLLYDRAAAEWTADWLLKNLS